MGFRDSLLRGRIDSRRRILDRVKHGSPEYLRIKSQIEEDEAELQKITNSGDQAEKKGGVETLFSGRK